MTELSNDVKIKLIVIVEELKVSIETKVNRRLKNDFKSASIVGDSAKRMFRLACAIGEIKKEVYDILYFLVDRRNEAAHNNCVKLGFDDFPRLDRILSKEKVEELKRLETTRWGHYNAILDAVFERIA